MSLRALLARWLGRRRIRSDQAELADLAVQFRQEISGDVVNEMTRRDLERENYLTLRAEIDKLRAYRRAADLRMMRHGVELPPDDIT